MNKKETEVVIRLLEKAIKEDYLSASEVIQFYELFKENKVGTFLETGDLYSCNKKNAERLIKTLKEGAKPDKRQLFLRVVEIVTLLIGLLTALLGLI